MKNYLLKLVALSIRYPYDTPRFQGEILEKVLLERMKTSKACLGNNLNHSDTGWSSLKTQPRRATLINE